MKFAHIVRLDSANVTKYLNALGLFRRTNANGKALSTSDELALEIGEAFWAARLKGKTKQGMLSPSAVSKAMHDQALQAFYKGPLNVSVMLEDGKVVGGFMVLNGVIKGLFTSKKGSGKWLVQQAIAAGGIRLDCFDGFLVEFYKGLGFREEARLANWTEGEPDVVFMTTEPELTIA